MLLVGGLLAYGCQLAWRLLPIPDATRTRLFQDIPVARKCFAYRFRSVFWTGILFSIIDLWQHDATSGRMTVAYWLILIGILSYVICEVSIRIHRHS